MLALFAASGLSVIKNVVPDSASPEITAETLLVLDIIELPFIEEEYHIPSSTRLSYENEVSTPPEEIVVVETVKQNPVENKTPVTKIALPASPKTEIAEAKNNLLLDLISINNKIKEYGKFIGSGMPENIYKTAMEQEWNKVHPTERNEDLFIDLTKKYTYKDLEAFMLNLAAYDGVDLHVIGRSEQGRSIYCITINFESDANKELLLFTGQVHANEFAGGLYILKQFDEMIKKAQTDKYTRLLLENITFKAIPVVNPDGREMILNGGNSSRKSNANGVDLNRNFPAVNASQVAKGTAITNNFSASPGLRYYAGPYLGSESETRAVIKWLHTYVPVASYYLDYHQQGRGVFAGKAWSTIKSQQNCKSFTKKLLSLFNSGLTSGDYIHLATSSTDGFNGAGGTTAEYAASIAMGMKYSPGYGILTLDVNGAGMPLVQFKSLEAYLEYYQPLNEKFCAVTVEITKGSNVFGYSLSARNAMDQEYKKYNYDMLLTNLAELVLGGTKISQLKQQH